LPAKGTTFEGDARVSGWGTTSAGDFVGSSVLLYAEVPLISDAGENVR